VAVVQAIIVQYCCDLTHALVFLSWHRCAATKLVEDFDLPEPETSIGIQTRHCLKVTYCLHVLNSSHGSSTPNRHCKNACIWCSLQNVLADGKLTVSHQSQLAWLSYECRLTSQLPQSLCCYCFGTQGHRRRVDGLAASHFGCF